MGESGAEVLTAISARAHVWRRRALLSLLTVALLGGLAAWVMSGLGGWLMVADPLEQARAIVVLSGHTPFRAMEAASIYRQGWAPEVWLTQPGVQPESAALARLGFKVVGDENYYNRLVLIRLGVPKGAIRAVGEGAQNTAEEIQVIAREVRHMSGDRVILVTSKPHSRRVRATWRVLVGRTPDAVVRHASGDPYNPDRWWRRTRDALAVSREVFGLMNLVAGFPVQPDRR